MGKLFTHRIWFVKSLRGYHTPSERRIGISRCLFYNLFYPQDHTCQKSLNGAISQRISGVWKLWVPLTRFC
jgi:hypothetical protein